MNYLTFNPQVEGEVRYTCSQHFHFVSEMTLFTSQTYTVLYPLLTLLQYCSQTSQLNTELNSFLHPAPYTLLYLCRVRLSLVELSHGFSLPIFFSWSGCRKPLEIKNTYSTYCSWFHKNETSRSVLNFTVHCNIFHLHIGRKKANYCINSQINKFFH